MKVICICNEKGGTGKTTVAVNLAVEAVREGLKVLLIDADVQGSAFSFYERRKENDSLPSFQCVLKPSKSLHKDIRDFENFDFVVIDTGGRDSKVFRSAILASDFCLIPTQPSQLDLWGVANTLEILEEAQAFKPIEVRILLNGMPAKAKIGQEALEALTEIKVPVFETCLGSRVAFRESIMEGKGVSEASPSSKAAQEIRSLWEEVKTWLGLK